MVPNSLWREIELKEVLLDGEEREVFLLHPQEEEKREELAGGATCSPQGAVSLERGR